MRKAVLLLVLVWASCSPSEDLVMYDMPFYAAYPPGMCKNLEPEYCEIIIDDELHILPVTEVNGGLISEGVMLVEGKHYMSDARVYDKHGNMTHFVARDWDDKGWVVVNTKYPMLFHASENNPWIPGQLFCGILVQY